MLDGLLTDVEIRDYGSVAIQEAAAGDTQVAVSDLTDYSADGGEVDILGEVYAYTTLVLTEGNIINDDGELEALSAGHLILSEPLRATVAESDPVLLRAGDQTATDVYAVIDLGGAAQTNLDDAGDPIRISIGYTDRAVWPVGHYDPPWPVLVSDDLTSIEAVPGITPVLDSGSTPAFMPTGVILPFGGTTPPEGYLLCDGTEVSRVTYANLFAVIGTNFGEGDGSTTFTLPPSGRFLLGADIDRPVGTLGGTATISTGQLPAHTHGAGSLKTSQDGAHVHALDVGSEDGASNEVLRRNVLDIKSTNSGAMRSNGAHTHTLSGSTGSVGAGNEFWPLFAAVTHIIRY